MKDITKRFLEYVARMARKIFAILPLSLLVVFQVVALPVALVNGENPDIGLTAFMLATSALLIRQGENPEPKKRKGKKSAPKQLIESPFVPTDEQREILLAFNKGKNLKIHAFAGTGKTSTLVYISSHTDRQGLYFAFNKRIANESKSKMPQNVTAATVHSFAWKWAQSEFQREKLFKTPTKNLIQQKIEIPETKVFPKYKFVDVVLRTIENFCQSGEDVIASEHIPWDHEVYISDKEILKKYESYFVDTASQVWEDMRDPNGEIPLGHDGYLKLWSLSNPKLNYDFLLIDEAQDLNPVMLKILNCYAGQKIIVGDSQQQIYSWRGAINAMDHELEAQNLYLTKTFRFGDELAKIANNILKILSVDKSIVSANGSGTIVTAESKSTPNAYLFRKNINLIGFVLHLFEKNKQYHIVDPNKRIDLLVDDYFRLNEGLWGKSSIFMGYNSWDDVVHMAGQKEGEGSLRTYVKLFQQNDPQKIREAVKRSEKKEAISYPSISTIHQAKGLEWPIVELFGDFEIDYRSLDFSKMKEEVRLLYVALTRAERELILPKYLLEFCQSPSKSHQNT